MLSIRPAVSLAERVKWQEAHARVSRQRTISDIAFGKQSIIREGSVLGAMLLIKEVKLPPNTTNLGW